MENEPKTSWCLIPPTVWENTHLSLTEKCLLGRIIALQDSKGYCFASNRYLATQLGKTPDWISHIITKLLNAGYLSREVTRGNNKQIVDRRIYLPLSTTIPPVVETYTPPVVKRKERVDIEENKKRRESNPLQDTHVRSTPQNLSEDKLVEISNTFNLPLGVIKEAYVRMVDYEPNRRAGKYKDHAAALRNWIRGDIERGVIKIEKNWKEAQ